MKVLEIEEDLVILECTSGPEEWIGTRIKLQLIEDENEVTLLFQH